MKFAPASPALTAPTAPSTSSASAAATTWRVGAVLTGARSGVTPEVSVRGAVVRLSRHVAAPRHPHRARARAGRGVRQLELQAAADHVRRRSAGHAPGAGDVRPRQALPARARAPRLRREWLRAGGVLRDVEPREGG